MKKLYYLWIAVSAFLSVPSIVLSSFEIEMKNGTCFVTDRYWEEAGMIKFNLYGGVTAFGKDKIKSIKETDRQPIVIEEKPGETKDQTPVMQKDNPPADVTVQEEKIEPPKITESQKEGFLSQKNDIESETGSVSDALKKARENNDKKELKLQRKKLLKLHTNRQTLFEDLKKTNGGKPPEWWPTLWPEDKEDDAP